MIFLIITIAGRDLLRFFATAGPRGLCHLTRRPSPALSFLSVTRIEFSRWNLPDTFSVHSRLSMLHGATVDLDSFCITLAGFPSAR